MRVAVADVPELFALFLEHLEHLGMRCCNKIG
jgi:hypothetical protein